MINETHCPLCSGGQIFFYHRDRRRDYLACADCSLVFVPAEFYLSPAAERAEYDLHCNGVDDPGYRHFLARLAEPLVQRLQPAAQGLDFGCGPGPALAHMLREQGFDVTLYDPFYQPDDAALTASYDFICATEVVEHLHYPGVELARLWSLLKPRGWLGVMTKLVRDKAAFTRWHYKNDATHVCFFSADTWRWWAEKYHARLILIGADVILLGRN